MAGEVLTGPFLHKRGSTEKVAQYSGPSGEIVIDLGKNTVVVQNGAAGGVPLALEGRQLIAGAGLKVNNTTSATLGSDITISVDANNMLAASDGLLYTNNDGKIASRFSLTYDEGTGRFSVIGEDGTTEIAYVTVPSHVTGLTTAEMVVSPTIDGTQQTGTFLHFVYTLSDNTSSEVFVNVTDLIDIYTAGDGITVTNNVVAAKLSSIGGLQFDASGNIELKINTLDGGLDRDANGALHVQYGSGLTVIGNNLQVLSVTEHDTGISVDQSDGIKIETGKSTEVTDAALEVKLSDATGNRLAIDNNGLKCVMNTVSPTANNIITDDDGAFLKLASSNNALQWTAADGLIMPLDCGVL